MTLVDGRFTLAVPAPSPIAVQEAVLAWYRRHAAEPRRLEVVSSRGGAAPANWPCLMAAIRGKASALLEPAESNVCGTCSHQLWLPPGIFQAQAESTDNTWWRPGSRIAAGGLR